MSGEILKRPLFVGRVGDEARGQLGELNAELEKRPNSFFWLTGTGKSKLVNALLDTDNLVPRGSSGAKTSVPIETAWHDEPAPRALVTMFTCEEWRADIEKLLDILYEGDDEITSFDAVDSGPGEDAWTRLREVYPDFTGDGLNQAEALNELLADEHVDNVLDCFPEIDGVDPVHFASELSQYVGPTATGGPQSWPLVKRVQIFIRAEPLRLGAIICDLPGLSDANQTREKTTKDYIARATAIWFVSPLIRANADSVVHNLLVDHGTRILRDGKAGSIAFIGTKSDDLQTSEILGQFPDFAASAEVAGILAERTRLIEERNSAKVNYDGLLKLEKEARLGVNSQVFVDEPSRLAAQSDLEVKAIAVERAEIAHRMLEMQVAKQQSLLFQACVDFRNQRFKDQTVNEFRQWMKKKGAPTDHLPLPVFAVSANDYLWQTNTAAADENGQTAKLRSPAATGIPALQQFLLSVTAHIHFKHATHLLNETRALLSRANIALTAEDGDEAVLHKHHVVFDDRLADFCVDLKDLGPKRIHGNTFLAIMRNIVWTPKKKPQVTFNFNKKFTDRYLDELDGPWGQLFGEGCAPLVPGARVSIQRLLRDFTDAVANPPSKESTWTSIVEELRTHTTTRLTHQAELLVAKTADVQRRATAAAENVVERFLAPTYAACAAERGPGASIRARERFFAKLDVEDPSLYDALSEHFAIRIDCLIDAVAQAQDEMSSSVVQLVETNFATIWSPLVDHYAQRDELIKLVAGIHGRITDMIDANERTQWARTPAVASPPAQRKRTATEDPADGSLLKRIKAEPEV